MILAFDTATPATTVALWAEGVGPLEARDDPPPGGRPGHATRLLALIDEVMTAADAGWEQVERIAVGTGPGTFTGLRVGIATAQALAQARGLPLVGVSTLHALALGASTTAAVAAGTGGRAARPETILAVLDARRGEAFAAAWPAGRPLDPAAALAHPRALAPDALAELAASLGSTLLAVGDGAVKFRPVLERSGAAVPEDGSELHRVTAINHSRIARGLPAGAGEAVRPDYLRVPDAEIARRARLS